MNYERDIDISGIRKGDRPDKAPTPRPAMNRPIVIWTIEYVVAVWIATPIVNIADHKRMEPRRPMLSVVNACAREPL